MRKIKRALVSLLIIFLLPLSSCSVNPDATIKGADINIKTATKETIEGVGNCYYLSIRYSQTILKFADYIETNKDATWTVSTDVTGKDVIPSRTVEISVGHPNSNLYYIYVSNDVAKKYETYPILIHRNHIFTITFDSDDGTYCSPENVEEGFCLEQNKIPTPSKTGHTFTGWDFDFSKPITNDITIKAKWDVNHYLITFDPNGGLVDTTQLDVYYGQQATGMPNPSRLGYTFMGWTYQGHIITENDAYYFDQNITVTASWEIINYTITYNLDGGSNNSDNPTTFTINDSIIQLKPATKDFCKFVCWKENGTSIAEINPSTLRNYILDASYTISGYTITYVLNGSENDERNPSTFTGFTDTFTLYDPSYKGMKFLGWFDQDNNKVTEVKKGTGKDLVLTAMWDYYVTLTPVGTSLASLDGDPSCVLIPEGVETIPTSFFAYKNVKEVILPSTLTDIDAHAFRSCRSLETIELPEGLLRIYDNAFEECTSLQNTSFKIPSTVIYLGFNIFYNTWVPHMSLDVTSSYGYSRFGIYYAGNDLSKYYALTGLSEDAFNPIIVGDYSIKDGCEIISSGSLSYQSEMETLNIPKSVRIICNGAVVSCHGLITINYAGTISEWEKVSKFDWSYWIQDCPATVVHCSDGTAPLY